MSIDDEKMDRVLDGDASDDDLREIQRWLEDETNLQRFARRAQLHSDLRRSLQRRQIHESALQQCGPSVDSASTQVTAKRHMPSQIRRRWMITAVALVTAAGLLIALLPTGDLGDSQNHASQPAAIVSQVNALLFKAELPWEVATLNIGQYHLQSGLLHLRFEGGVMVYVEAPARFEVAGGKRLVLQGGRLSASVPPAGIGFTVETPEADVIDFGTEFSVEVDSGASEVHVFDGLVRVQPKASDKGKPVEAVDLVTSQAVKIKGQSERPLDIELARDRFIRNFDEPKRKYARVVKRLSPLVYYRMPIRDRGLVSEPPQHSGVVLTGEGDRPPHARGVFTGGSLRMGADSTGRGGRVDTPPALITGEFTLVVFVYLEQPSRERVVVSNLNGTKGNFSLAQDGDGRLQAKLRTREGDLKSVTSDQLLPLKSWHQVVVTADGDQLKLYVEGRKVAATSVAAMADAKSDPVWIGTDGNTTAPWDGRVDELSLYDRALDDSAISELHQVAVEEPSRTQ